MDAKGAPTARMHHSKPAELVAAHERALAEPFDLRRSRFIFAGIVGYKFIADLTFLTLGGFMVTLLIYFFIYGAADEVGQASRLVGNARFVQNVIGLFSEALGSNLSDQIGRKPFFYVRVITQAIAIAIVIIAPSASVIYLGAVFLGISQCLGAIAPAAVMDLSDPQDKSFFVRRYVFFVFASILGILAGTGLIEFILNLTNGNVEILAGAQALAIAAIIGCAINIALIFFGMRETLVATVPLSTALTDWKTLLKDGLTLPIKLGWSTANYRWCMLCHLCNKYSTVGAVLAFFALGVYRFDPPPSGLLLIQFAVLLAIIIGQVWIVLAVPFLGIGIALTISYAIGVLAMLLAAFTSSYYVFLGAVLPFGIAASTSAPMRNLFGRQVATTEVGLSQASYDIHDIIMEAIGSVVAGNVFAAVVTPKGFSRGSAEARADLAASLPLILAAIGFVIAAAGAVVIHKRMKNGQLTLLSDDKMPQAPAAEEAQAVQANSVY